MQKNMAQIIVYGLAEQQLWENFDFNKQIINRIVEGWEQKVYVVPVRALHFDRSITYSSKHKMM